MSTSTWFNNDGLFLQYGTQKAIPEMGGDYLVYGETREVEQYIPLVPTTWGTGNVSVPGATASAFSGSSTPIAAGIQSMTTFMPLQVTAPQSASSSALTLSNPQLFIERVELLAIQTVAPATLTMNVGLVTTNPGSTVASTFVQVTPNAGGQIIGTDGTNGTTLTLNANVGTAGCYTLFNQPSQTGAAFKGGVPVATTGTAGVWVGTNVPLVTNSITPLPTNAWISTLITGTATAGLLKLRVKYFIYGNINY